LSNGVGNNFKTQDCRDNPVLCMQAMIVRGKSKPEWGLNLSQENMPLLEQYKFGQIVHKL